MASPPESTLPTGTVTFLFTDIEGSTALLSQLGDDYGPLLDAHRDIIRKAIAPHGGYEFGSEGDALFIAFGGAREAVAAALEAQAALSAHPWEPGREIRVRMGLHTGEAHSAEGDYWGLAVHKAARVASAAHGGQILVSATTGELVSPELPDGAELVDLGPHRLKDMGEAEALYQLCDDRLTAVFPPPRTLSVLPNNLPVQRTSFVGRADDVRELAELVPQSALVTLTGPGGTGKTRLALEVAAQLAESFPDGVWLAELASVSDPELVAQTVASVVGVREGADALASRMRPRRLLLILDNCEHLVEACAHLAGHLLREAPGLRVLATSREPLGVGGERVWAVPPLHVPAGDASLDTLGDAEAVRLFVDRAAQARRGFALTPENASDVARICSRLDGIPLAIELAAARVRLLAPADIARRLADVFGLLVGGDRTVLPRQQTLRALIDWSYDLLSEDERVLFSRLAVFAGTFELEGAEAVCGDGLDVFTTLAGLVDKSLVGVREHAGATRYAMLETIREYAWEKEPDREALQRRHCEWFVALVRRVAPELEGPNPRPSIVSLDAEHDNLRRVLDYTRETDGALCVELTIALVPFWEIRGHVTEALQRFENATPLATRPIDRFRLNVEAGWFTFRRGDSDTAEALYASALEAAREAGDAAAEAWALLRLALVARGRPDEAEATRLLDRSLELARASADVRRQAEALLTVSLWDQQSGDYAKAEEYAQEGVRLWEASGDAVRTAGALGQLGAMAWFKGDLDRARELWQQVLERRRSFGERNWIAISLINLGTVSMAIGDGDAAAGLYTEALGIARSLGNADAEQQCLINLGVLAEEVAFDWDTAKSRFTEALELSRRLGNRDNEVQAVFGLGRVATAVGDYDGAQVLLEKGLALAQELDRPFELTRAYRELGWVALNRGDAQSAHALLSKSLETARSLENPMLHAEIGSLLGEAEQALGNHKDARRLYEEGLAAFRARGNPREIVWALCQLGRLAIDESDLDGAAALFGEALDVGRTVDPDAVEVIAGLATVAASLGRPSRAARLFGVAEALRERTNCPVPVVWAASYEAACERALSELGRHVFEEAWAQGRGMSAARAYDYARKQEEEEEEAIPDVRTALAGAPAPTGAVVFRREGDFWTVGRPGQQIRVKDTKGMGYVALLLQRPGAEHHALDMVSALSGGTAEKGARVAAAAREGDLAAGTGHAGELLDPQAKEAYRRRVEDLRDEIAEAEAFGDPARAERAREELDAIAKELGSALGLGGRDRVAASDAERARGAVSKAIRAAVKRIADELPELGSHLDVRLKTGVFCSYEPDPHHPVDWEL